MSAARHQAAGFTLLEMLLAISLLTLLAGLAYGTLRIGVRGWEAADVQADQGDALRVAWPFLHQTLEAARPLVAPERNRQRFDGERERLHWITELPVHFASDGPRALTLAVEDGAQPGRRQLVLISQAVDDTRQTDQDGQRAVLVDDIEQLGIAYYGPPADGGAAAWQQSWQERTTLPYLVRLDITPRDGARWPQLVAHPYLAGVLPDEGEPQADDPERND